MEKFVYASALIQKPVFNHSNKTITVSDKFLRASKDPTSNEFYDLMKLRELCPGYEVVSRSHHSPRRTEKSKNIKKFVPYDKMKTYINLLPERDILMEQLEGIKKIAKAYPRNSATIVFNWFNETFPDYRHAPKIDKDGNLIATVNVVNFADYKKSVEEKERAKALAKAQAELPETADPQEDELKKVV